MIRRVAVRVPVVVVRQVAVPHQVKAVRCSHPACRMDRRLPE